MQAPGAPIAYSDAAWLKIKPFLLERIEALRSELEADLTHEQTIAARARIGELRRFMNIVQPDLLEPENAEIPEEASALY